MFETDCNWGSDSIRREMTVREFLESVPAVGELVVVTRGGWPTCTVHIDCEDSFRLRCLLVLSISRYRGRCPRCLQ